MNKILKVLSLLLFLTLFLQCDPGWSYLIEDVKTGEKSSEYFIDIKPLTINVKSHFFGGNRVILTIKSNEDIIIYPKYSYIKSLNYPNKILIPRSVQLFYKNNSNIISEKYDLYLDKQSTDESKAFSDGFVKLYEGKHIRKPSDKSISFTEYNTPFALKKDNELSIEYIFPHFYEMKDPYFKDIIKDDFIFYVDLFNNKKELQIVCRYIRY